MGVARLNFGGLGLPPAPSCNGGTAAPSPPGPALPPGMLSGGAAALLTGLWLGLAGIASPKRGTLFPLCDRWPGMGGRSKGTGEAMLDRSGVKGMRAGLVGGCCSSWGSCWEATMAVVKEKAVKGPPGGGEVLTACYGRGRRRGEEWEYRRGGSSRWVASGWQWWWWMATATGSVSTAGRGQVSRCRCKDGW